MVKKKTKYIHAGRYVAEVEIDLIDSEDEWAPYLSVEDAATGLMKSGKRCKEKTWNPLHTTVVSINSSPLVNHSLHGLRQKAERKSGIGSFIIFTTLIRVHSKPQTL